MTDERYVLAERESDAFHPILGGVVLMRAGDVKLHRERDYDACDKPGYARFTPLAAGTREACEAARRLMEGP